jgi:hypothetical protein
LALRSFKLHGTFAGSGWPAAAGLSSSSNNLAFCWGSAMKTF